MLQNQEIKPENQIQIQNSNCVVCERPTSTYNYGTISCNACVMFFRRIDTFKNPLKKPCKFGGTCPDFKFSNCRPCRYQKCLDSGMTRSKITFSENYKKFASKNGSSRHFLNYAKLGKLIKNLLELDENRKIRLATCQLLEDPSIDEVIENFGHLKFSKKPENAKFSTYEWGFLEQLTTIDFLKNLEFSKFLDISDLKILIKSSYFKTSLIINGYRSMSFKSEEMIFLDGVDILPELLISGIPSKFLIKIRSRLVGRMIELAVTQEEFLLLSVVLFCDPGLLSLSPHGKSIISSYQRTYTSALFQHCLINYPTSGPSRFTDLLSLSTVINATFRDFCQLTLVMMMNAKQPVENPKMVVKNCLNTDN